MNLQQRCQAVFEAGYKLGTTSFRVLAAATKLSKSSVHRLYQRIQRRNQYPESPLWETEAGQQWLRLLYTPLPLLRVHLKPLTRLKFFSSNKFTGFKL